MYTFIYFHIIFLHKPPQVRKGVKNDFMHINKCEYASPLTLNHDLLFISPLFL